MADEQAQIVIIDDEGTKHVFPAGFDPQQAIGIVRQQTAIAKPLPADEPDTYMGGFLKGAKEGMIGGATGFAKGLIPGAIEGVKGIATLPITLIKGVIDAGFGGARLYNDPVGTLTEAYNTYKKKPGELSDTIKSALDLARNDPEAFGKEVGNLTGQVEVGIGASKLAPLAPRPVARAIGNIAEQVGTKGAWPIRMMGAHQLGSGNPLGMATIALPEVLRKGGTSMKQWGENDPLLIQGDIDKFKGVSEPSATSRIGGETTIDKRPPVRIMSNAPDVMERNKDLFQSKVKGASTEVPAKELAQLKSQIPNNPELLDLMIRRRQAELAGTPMPELPSYKKPVRTSESPVRIAPELPKIGDGTPAPQISTVAQSPKSTSSPVRIAPDNPSQPSQSLTTGPNSSSKAIDSIVKPVLDIDPSAEVRISHDGGSVAIRSSKGATAETLGQGDIERMIKSAGHKLTSTYKEAGVDPTGEWQIYAKDKDAWNSAIDALPDKFSGNPIDQELTQRAARVPIKKVQGSKSRRSPMSQVNPKLTLDEEKELFGNGPIYKITELPPDVLQKLLDRRAARSSTYRINEGLDKGARNASLRDSE